jgi:hypothetical protein
MSQYVEYLTRRRVPGWVREWSSPTLHGVAWMLQRVARTKDLSVGQEALWGYVVSELEYRHRRDTRTDAHPCWCPLCVPPFPDHGPQAQLRP